MNARADEADPSGNENSTADTYSRWDVLTTAVMALATVLTAWSGFQAAKWSGEMSIEFSKAGAARTESAQQHGAAGQQITIDYLTFADWLGHIGDNDADSAEYVRERFRDELAVAVDAWALTNPQSNPDAPQSPFDMTEYSNARLTSAGELTDDADDFTTNALTANSRGDRYTSLTVLFATVLLFAGLAGQRTNPLMRRAMMTLALTGLVVGGVLLATFPVLV